MKVKALCPFIFSLSLILSPPALAEDGSAWKEVDKSLYAGEEVVILPLQPYIQEQPPPPHQIELYFDGAQVEGASVAQATLTFPPIAEREKVVISPFGYLKGEQSGEGDTLSIGGGLTLSIGDGVQVQLSIEEMVHPFSQTAYKVDAVFQF